jgi:hypothetical protein
VRIVIQIPLPRGTHESLVEYDQRRSIKEFLLDRIISACVETADASRLLASAIGHETPALKLAAWEKQAYSVLRALYRRRLSRGEETLGSSAGDTGGRTASLRAHV